MNYDLIFKPRITQIIETTSQKAIALNKTLFKAIKSTVRWAKVFKLLQLMKNLYILPTLPILDFIMTHFPIKTKHF